MDPNNGDILAMASVPSFDPNDFIPKISAEKWKTLSTDATAPLLNRALNSSVPGSTFKVIVSLAAFKAGKLTPNTEINCPPSITIGNHTFHNDDTIDRGEIGLHEALRSSVNTFYYQLGIRTGIKNIDEMSEELGLGQPTGLPLPEDPGIIPGPDWLKEHSPRERWTDAYTANTSIGQGSVQTTPLQMAIVMSAVANGGTVYYPRLIQGITDLQGKPVQEIPTRIRGELGVKFGDMAALHDALLAVVESGTATTVKFPDVKVAGKTGTAQAYRRLNGSVVRDLHTWFYCFAPYEKPRYVVCVLVEGGQWGGSTNGPIVHDILEQIFQMEKTGKGPDLTYLTPAVGNFQGVTDYVAPAAMAPDANGGAAIPTGIAVPDQTLDVPEEPSTSTRTRGSKH
jgi:penicillin-binding protein 2